jgi:hypothetical protein
MRTGGRRCRRAVEALPGDGAGGGEGGGCEAELPWTAGGCTPVRHGRRRTGVGSG